MSRKAIVAISLVVWFAPSLLVLWQLARNGTKGAERVLVWLVMYGAAVVVWVRPMLQPRWVMWALAAVISIGLPVALVMLMLHSCRWRWLVLAAGLLVSCGLTAVGYCLLRA